MGTKDKIQSVSLQPEDFFKLLLFIELNEDTSTGRSCFVWNTMILRNVLSIYINLVSNTVFNVKYILICETSNSFSIDVDGGNFHPFAWYRYVSAKAIKNFVTIFSLLSKLWTTFRARNEVRHSVFQIE